MGKLIACLIHPLVFFLGPASAKQCIEKVFHSLKQQMVQAGFEMVTTNNGHGQTSAKQHMEKVSCSLKQ